jgi:hypothetical protein
MEEITVISIDQKAFNEWLRMSLEKFLDDATKEMAKFVKVETRGE